MSIRRLPVYLLIDCSESMAGPAIESVNQGVAALLAELRTNPQALETAFLSIITFSREAKQVLPLTELLQVQVPRFGVQPGTALGAALQLLATCMKKDIVRTTSSTKGDYRPLVFLMTDGQPTDAWEDAADAVRGMKNPKIANLYAIGCGDDIDIDSLYRLTDIVLSLPDMSPDSFKKFFVWLTASVGSASVNAATTGDDTLSNAIELPDGVLTVARRGSRRTDDSPRQVFLHARCSKTKGPYLMRFVREPDGDRYVAKASHPLEAVSDCEAKDLAPVDSSLLIGCPPCPYCGNVRAGLCPCGTLFCAPTVMEGPVTCPRCGSNLMAGDGGPCVIRQSEG